MFVVAIFIIKFDLTKFFKKKKNFNKKTATILLILIEFYHLMKAREDSSYLVYYMTPLVMILTFVSFVSPCFDISNSAKI